MIPDPDRRHSRSRGPVRAADLLGELLGAVQKRSARDVFKRALDAELHNDESKYCHVVSYRKGTLYIEVASAPLFAELSGFRRESLRIAMNDRLENQRIAKIVFRMDGTGHV